ncbi:MAG: FHA domain-containing protein [Myxococcales bacterium]|nr:FHA domain-containing protein [Myxococcales bacterium]
MSETETAVMQDLIRAAMGQSRDAFLRQVEVPVLVGEAQRTFSPFQQGQTRLTERRARAPLARELIRRGHQLPVFFLRQTRLGPPDQIRVGRAPENDLCIKDDTVSARHAVFQRDERTGTWVVQDLASMNGTLVNGNRLVVGKPSVLFDGDVITVGNQSFLFFYPQGLFDVLQAELSTL